MVDLAYNNYYVINNNNYHNNYNNNYNPNYNNNDSNNNNNYNNNYKNNYNNAYNNVNHFNNNNNNNFNDPYNYNSDDSKTNSKNKNENKNKNESKTKNDSNTKNSNKNKRNSKSHNLKSNNKINPTNNTNNDNENISIYSDDSNAYVEHNIDIYADTKTDMELPNPYYHEKVREEEEEGTNIFKYLMDKLLSTIGPIKKSRKLKKYKKKIKAETVDLETTNKRLEGIDHIPFFYFGEVTTHPIYQLYKYIEITNNVRNIDFMEQWLVDSNVRQRCYEEICQMNDDYLLKGKSTYDNQRPSYQDKWYNQLKMAVRNYAPVVEFECQSGVIQFPDAVWDVLGCMVFKQYMGNNVNSTFVCHIDHIFPLSRIKGGASELQNLCVLNKTVNSTGRKGKYHLFEMYEDSKVNGILDGCVRRSTLVAFFNSNLPKNISSKKTANFKKALEDATLKLLLTYKVPQNRVASIEAVPNPTTNIHTIHVKFNSSGK